MSSAHELGDVLSPDEVSEAAVSTSPRGVVLGRAVEVVALSGFAITQPVLDAFGRAPEHFVFLGISPAEIVLFAILVAVVPAVALVVVTFLITVASRRAGQVAHILVLAALAALTGVQLGWRVLGLGSFALVAFAAVVGGSVALLWSRFEGFRLGIRYAAALPVVAIVSFLFLSPVSDLVITPDVDAASLELVGAPPLVMLVFDELPTATLVGADGEIDASLYPNFARLAQQATWYRNNSSNSNYTVEAVPALLSGLAPDEAGAMTLKERPDNLFTLLGETYDIRADEAPISLCPRDLCLGVPVPGGGFGRLLRDARRLWVAQVSIDEPGSALFDLVERTTTVVPQEPVEGLDFSEAIAVGIRQGVRLETTSPLRFSGFLDAIEISARPTLHYLHIQVPHTPFRFYPNGVEYVQLDDKTPGFESDKRWGVSEAPAIVSRQRHILQTQYADALLGRLLDRLEDQGMYDDTLLIVASDHGISFNPGESHRGVAGDALPASELDEIFWSLLMIKPPGQDDGGVSALPTQLIDVLPTVMGILDADPGWDLDGTAIDALSADAEDRTICRRALTGPLSADSNCELIDGTAIVDVMIGSGTGSFLPATESELRVFQAGPFGDLVGLAVDELSLGSVSEHQLRILGRDRFEDVRTTGPVPGLLGGELASGEEGIALAFALNGTIAAVTESYSTEAETGAFTAILPLALFVDGANHIEAFVIESSGAEPVFHPLTTVPA